MKNLFRSRTQMHIALVGKNLERFNNYRGLHLKDLKARARIHDQSKFGPEERDAYTWLTWNYRCQKQGIPLVLAPAVQENIQLTLKSHARKNFHHPESHDDINEMSLLDLVEMIADWTAIAQENGKDSCMGWAQENLEKKWSFSGEKKNLIFDLIKELDQRNKNEA